MLFSKVSRMERGSWSFTKRVVLATAVMMVFICLSAGLLAQPFIGFFYGEAFKNSVKALWWLLPGMFSLSISTIYMNFLAGKGMPLVAVIIPLIAFLANFILNLFMIPLLGISGASISSSLAYTSMLAVLFIYFIRKAKYYEQG
ncbi:MAG: polysaccharide biosynthesis C-terminal domain-containing protein [Actinobacteria bacterium]|nr:polysaccharide biosynthesis C-terminal domain-containing protein [Actinomycetota bacterium]